MPPPRSPLPSLATKTVPLPPTPHERAFAQIAAELMNDPMLARWVKSWRRWEGLPTDGDVPVPESCPWVRLTPTATASRRATSTDHLMPWVLSIEVATAGTSLVAMQRTWARIVEVLFPTVLAASDALDAKLQAVGVSGLEVIEHANGVPYSPVATGPAQVDLAMMVGLGRIAVDQYVQTSP